MLTNQMIEKSTKVFDNFPAEVRIGLCTERVPDEEDNQVLEGVLWNQPTM